MKIIFFAHPHFTLSQSMPRFTNYLLQGMKARGHNVECWYPTPRFYDFPAPTSLKKWLGYIDQYIVFPYQVRERLRACSKQTLFVFTDHALGPWVPLVADRLHVIHCHDFLAQRSALDEIPQNRTRFSGKQYQLYIRKGYSRGKAFISVSNKTREDLQRFLEVAPAVSEVVYNGLNQTFAPKNADHSRDQLGKKLGLNCSQGFLLHVGGNQWYKNRIGVIKIYNAWRLISGLTLPLLLFGERPTNSLLNQHSNSPFRSDIHFVSGLDDVEINLAYSGASVFLFPSIAEGFGWPIIEAMASGCPVITTNEAPLTEVAGHAAFYVAQCPVDESKIDKWAEDSAKIVNEIILLPHNKRKAVIEMGLNNAAKFNMDKALDKIEKIYQKVLMIN